MKFLYPAFLFALLLVGLPLIIHFFNFKRHKTVYFSNVSFLKAVQKDTRKKSVLKQLVLLAVRILFVVFLVVSFAQPYIPGPESNRQKARQVVGIYVDNSFSMKLEGENGVLLEQAREKAVKIAESYRTGTKFALLTNDFLPQHQYLFSKEQLIALLGEIKESPHPVSLKQIDAQARQLMDKAGKEYGQTFYLLSDFQKNNFNFSELENDTARWTYLMPFAPGKVNNLYIDSCWFELPGRKIGQSEKLMVKIVNSSDEDYHDLPVRFSVNDSVKAIANLNVGAGEKQVVEMNFVDQTAGFQYAKVELNDYPLVYDNTYYLAYDVKGKANVLAIFEPGDKSADYFRALFADDDFINYTEAQINSLQVSQLKQNQCVFLVNLKKMESGLISELNSFLEQAGTLAIFPSANADVASYNQLLGSLNGQLLAAKDTGAVHIADVNYNESLFRNVFRIKEQKADLPSVKNSYRFQTGNAVPGTALMSFRNGQEAMDFRRFGNGNVYTFAFPVDLVNQKFLKHLIFVPAVYNIAMNSFTGSPIAYPIELQNFHTINRSILDGNDKQLLLKKRGEQDEFLPAQKTIGANLIQLDFGDFAGTAGHYELLSGDKPIEALAFNYKRQESEPSFFSVDELKEKLVDANIEQSSVTDPGSQDFKKVLDEQNNGKPLSRSFLMLALFFLLSEVLISRFWK